MQPSVLEETIIEGCAALRLGATSPPGRGAWGLDFSLSASLMFVQHPDMLRSASPTCLALVLSLAVAAGACAAGETPPEIVAARKRYEAAAALAMKPLREKYLQELQQIKNRALSLKNLDLAVAVDNEMKTVEPAGPISRSDTVADWENRLIGTSWVWDKGKTITFQENGSVTPRFGMMQWKFTAPGSMEFHFENGDHGTVTFEKSLVRGTIHVVGSGGKKTTQTLERVRE